MASQNQINPKETAMKKKTIKAKTARTSSEKPPNKKSGPMKMNSKNATAKKMMKKSSKVGALKKKTMSKMTARSSVKRETRGFKKAMSKSAVERAERANKRSALKDKEALSDKEPRAKRARLNLRKKVDDLPGLHLASLLSTSDGVADIAAASGSRPLGGVEVSSFTLSLLSQTSPGGSDEQA